MSTLDVLKAARALISDPARWTQGAAARNQQGDEVYVTSSDAVCWCATGAVDVALSGTGADAAWNAVMGALRTAGAKPYVFHFNDTHTHAEVVALFDTAIQQLESRVNA